MGMQTMPETSREGGTAMATDWNHLAEEHEMAYFRADVCPGSPQSFSLDEKRRICEEMEASTNEIDEAMRRDFQQLPPIAQGKMLDLLQKADPEHFDFWMETLVGKIPDDTEGLKAVGA